MKLNNLIGGIVVMLCVAGCAYVEYQPQPTPEPKPNRYDTQYNPRIMFAKNEEK